VRHGELPDTVTGVLAVVAHPDDESFGLGAVLSELVVRDVPASLICFTRGEASTLRAGGGDLVATRALELQAAGAELRLSRVELHSYPDGGLATVPLDELAGHVLRVIAEERPSHLLAFDLGGVTGHPDHDRATRAALAAARTAGRPLLAWTVPAAVAEALNAEFGTAFRGRDPDSIDLVLRVHRERQRRAIACHRGQAIDNPVLYRRLAALGDREYLRVIGTSAPGPDGPAGVGSVPFRAGRPAGRSPGSGAARSPAASRTSPGG
jgi:LmbE family N-acetylglucosaminyl deacetylase